MPKPTSAKNKTGQRAPAAAASPAENEGAESGAENEGVVSDVLHELGGLPEPRQSDTADTSADAADEADGGAEDAAAAAEAAGDENDEHPEGEAAESEEETEEETEEEAQAGEGEAEGAEEAPDGDQLPQGVKKELKELREDRRQLREQLARLEQQLGNRPGPTDASAQRTASHQEQIVLRADNPEQLEEARASLEATEDWCLLNRDGGELPSTQKGGEPRVLDRDQVASIYNDTRRALRLLPKREQSLVRENQAFLEAAKVYPELAEPSSIMAQTRQWLVQVLPDARKLPNLGLVVGDALAGEVLRGKGVVIGPKDTLQQIQAKIQKAIDTGTKSRNGGKDPDRSGLPGKRVETARKPPPAVPGAPVRSAAAAPGRKERVSKAFEKAHKSGSLDDVADLVEASLG